METFQMHLTAIVNQNPDVQAAWFDDPVNPTKLVILTGPEPRFQRILTPKALEGLPIEIIPTGRIQTLRTTEVTRHAANEHQQCQNEPIKMGTQIQPEGANWLGTAGSPVSWIDERNERHWGFLSNWHVLADEDERVGRTCHQPSTSRPACATLAAWSTIRRIGANRVDGAIADALVNGRHTIAPEILGVGRIGQQPTTATVGLPAVKAGRTTGVTTGTCVAVGASVQVNYGGFNATFEDQDIYSADRGEFSAPGDSGSLIVAAADNSPMSLLFAGSSEITIGNPIRHVNELFGLVWPFN